MTNIPSSPAEPERPPPRMGLLFVSMGIVAAVFIVGILLWLPHRSDGATGTTDLGTSLVGGAVVAGAILLIQLSWDRRVRAQEQHLQDAADRELIAREERFQKEDRDRQERFELDAIARRDLENQWNDQLIRATDRHDSRIARLLLSILIQTGLKGADLRDIDLSGVRLAGLDLTSVNLTGAKLVGCDLLKTTLHSAKLDRANLFGATLDGSDLGMARLSGARLEGASFAKCNLVGADLSNAHIDRDTVFKGATSDASTRWPTTSFKPLDFGVDVQ